MGHKSTSTTSSTRGGGSGLTICVSVSLLRLVSFIIVERGVCFARPIITARSKLPFSVNFPDEWQLKVEVAKTAITRGLLSKVEFF